MPALDAVLTDLRSRNLDALYCLGDLVGYGAFPNEVTEAIRASGMRTIMGNYDDGVGFDRDECGCAYRDPEEEARGHRSLMWTRAHTSDANKSFLRTLESEVRTEIDGRRVLFVHGSPRKMNEYLFEDRALSSFERIAATSNADIIVFGHTHKPYTKLVNGVLFVNAGSIGKPKDGDWRACYVVLEPSAEVPVQFIRLEYDIDRAMAAIRATNELPTEFADDLKQVKAWIGR